MTHEVLVPGTPEEAAETLAEASRARSPVLFSGGGTKLGWGSYRQPAGVEISTRGLDGVLEHNAADLTAVVGSGTSLARAQSVFALANQRLALDPPDGGGRATIGGIVATGDSGPLRHRYGGPRDQIVGLRVALSDGTLCRSGGKVIKNVAGYDLGKLFAGSFGTLGLILEVVLRLHPVARAEATAMGAGSRPDDLQRAAVAVGDAGLELEALDMRWDGDGGALLALATGTYPGARAERAAGLMRSAGLDAEVASNAEPEWALQRALQRDGGAGAIMRVSALRTRVAQVVSAARERGAAVVGRAGVGLLWVRLPAARLDDLAASVRGLRRDLLPSPSVVLDAPEALRAITDVWGEIPSLSLMRRVKERFDPAGVCNPGLFAGGS